MVEERLKRLDASLGQQAPKMVDPRHGLVYKSSHGGTENTGIRQIEPLCSLCLRVMALCAVNS